MVMLLVGSGFSGVEIRPMVTAIARGRERDLASGFFERHLCIDDSPAIGSGHAPIGPYSLGVRGQTGRPELHASTRRVTLYWQQAGGRAKQGGQWLALILKGSRL